MAENEGSSKWAELLQGVPQGWVLGPFFPIFKWFIFPSCYHRSMQFCRW